MALLVADSLIKRFGGVVAVDHFSLEIEPGEIVGLIGPNGAGKTTIFNLITQVTPSDAGHLLFSGQEIDRLRPHQICHLGIARTFQNIRLFTGLNVRDNIIVALGESEAHYGFVSSLFKTPSVRKAEAKFKEQAWELMEMLGLTEFAHEQPEGLPYGLQRRLEIARALANRPKLLLLDEPAAGLNPSEVQGMVHLIQSLQENFDLTILLIEHHMEVVMPICSRIYVLNFGKTIAVGSPEEVQSNPLVLAAYLGEEA